MNILTGFTDSPHQMTTFSLDDGSSATLTLYFRPQQRGWFFDLTYGNLVMQGQRLTYHKNFLRQFVLQLPFGLACLTNDLTDPKAVTDFSSGKAVLVLLTTDDAKLVETVHFKRNE